MTEIQFGNFGVLPQDDTKTALGSQVVAFVRALTKQTELPNRD